MKNDINIAMTFDNNYLPYAYVALFSLLENNSDNAVNVYILHSNLTATSQALITDLLVQNHGKVHFISVNQETITAQLPKIGRWQEEAYYRLLIPSLIPDEIHRILYIDSDIIVNSSLNELFAIPMNDFDIGGCYDLNIADASLDIFLANRHPHLTESFNLKTYINSGVLLFNLDRLRNYTLSVYIDAIRELEYKVLAPDQDIINYVHYGKILQMDPKKYNYPAYVAFLQGYSSEDLRNNAPIVHYIGEKPWSGGNHAHFPTESLWWDYAIRTPFKESLYKDYIYSSTSDLLIFNYVQGIDKIRDELYNENIRLKKELVNATNQMKQIIAMFEKDN